MGRLLGRYEVLGTLGSGGGAEVFRVRDTARGGRIVALKRARAASGRQGLLDEIACLSDTPHPNLPAVYDFHADVGHGCAAYTLEEVHGEAIDRAVERLGPAVMPALVAGLLRALDALHGRGFVHGDIHPHNVLVSELAGDAASLSFEAVASAVRLIDLAPRDAQAFGALPFVAPERLEGGPATPATDAFAVGVLIHRVLTGVFPYPDFPTITATEPLAREERLGTLHDLVRGLVAPRPENRLMRMGEALAALGRAVGHPIPPYDAAAVSLAVRSAPLTSGSAAVLQAARDAAERSRTGGVVLVRGCTGSGRSRLLSAIERQLWSVPSAHVSVVRPGGADAAGLLAAPSLLRSTPFDVGPPSPPVPEQSAEDGGRAYAIAVTKAAELLAAQPSFALIVDDPEQLSAFDTDVLKALLRRADDPAEHAEHRHRRRSRPLVVVGCGVPFSDSLVAEAPAADVIDLAPLDALAVGSLIERAFGGRAPSPGLVHAITEASGGLPAVIVQALAAAFEAGLLVIDDATVALSPGAPEPLPVPKSVQEAAAASVASLTGVDAELAAFLALAPVPAPEALIATVFGAGLGLASADRLVRLGLLGRHDFVNDEERETTLSLGSATLAAAAARLPLPIRALQAAANLDDADLSLAARVVSATAALRLDSGEAGRASAAAKALLACGRARPALVLLRLVETLAGRVDTRLVGDACALTGDDDGALAAYATLGPADGARARGSLLVRRGRYKEAIEALEGAVEAGLGDAETLGWLARASLMLARYDDALAYCDRAHTVAGVEDPRLAFVRGLVRFYRAEYPAALLDFDRARAALEAKGEIVERANVVNAIGLVHYRRAELDLALTAFEQALALAAESGDVERAFLTLMNVAIIQQSRGSYALAEARYLEALGKARLGGHRSGVMRIAQNLGNLYRYLGDLAEARRQLLLSREIATSESNAYMIAYNDGLLGEVAFREGDLPDAERLLRQATAGFVAVGSTSELADMRCHLAAVLLSRGCISEARQQADDAFAAASNPAMPVILAHARLQLAEVARRLQSPDLDVALEHATAAEALFESLESRPELRWQIPLVLHRVRRDRGEGAEALDLGLRALGSLEALADSMPESRREQFLSARPRREALAELRWLRGLAGGRSGPSTRLQRLLDVNQRLSEEQDPARLIEYIIDSAILLTAAERGFLLMRPQKGDGPLEVVVARNIDQENIKNKRYKVSYSIAQRVFETGDPVITTDAMGDERYSQYLSIHHLKLRSVLCVPLRRGTGGKGEAGVDIVGALYVDNRFQAAAFTQDDMVFMEAFAHQAAIAFGNARLLEERQRALDDLARSQARVEELNQKLTQRLAEKEKALEETEQLLVVQRRQNARSVGYEAIVGDSGPIRAMFHVLDRVRGSDVPVLVTGESGTGKELVARAIHSGGPRKDRTFIAINCSSIPETLIESELFGHMRGAFTGATSDKKGVFEAADKGTLFLDEIGEMPLEMQAKLLRALQSGEIQKVGSPRTVIVDVRIIAATNRNLREMVKAKTFREDLFYRLAVVTMELPPLRARPDDIPMLVQHFIEKNRLDRLGRVEHVSPEVLRLMMRYSWPGNVRELETVIKNASIFCETDTLRPEDLSNFPGIVGGTGVAPAPTTRTVRPLADLERDAIVHALEVFSGNKKKTSEELGIDRRTLYNKLSMYGIAVERRAHMLDRDD